MQARSKLPPHNAAAASRLCVGLWEDPQLNENRVSSGRASIGLACCSRAPEPQFTAPTQRDDPSRPPNGSPAADNLWFSALALSRRLLKQLLLLMATRSWVLDPCLVRLYEFLPPTPTLTPWQEKVSFYDLEQVRIFFCNVCSIQVVWLPWHVWENRKKKEKNAA